VFNAIVFVLGGFAKMYGGTLFDYKCGEIGPEYRDVRKEGTRPSLDGCMMIVHNIQYPERPS